MLITLSVRIFFTLQFLGISIDKEVVYDYNKQVLVYSMYILRLKITTNKEECYLLIQHHKQQHKKYRTFVNLIISTIYILNTTIFSLNV